MTDAGAEAGTDEGTAEGTDAADTGAGTAGPPTGLRVLTWNVRDMLGDPLAVARLLREARPDVVLLQEAPRWPGSRWRLSALARSAGLLFVAGGRESAGTAMLCSARAEVTAAEAFALPVRGRRTRPRGAVVARVGLPGTARVRVASVHLGLRPQERAEHVRLLLERLAPAGGAVLIGGDLNERPGGASWTAFGRIARDPDPNAPPTFPAHHPRMRIDALFAGPAVTVEEYARWRPDPARVRMASDHLPVLAVVRPPGA